MPQKSNDWNPDHRATSPAPQKEDEDREMADDEEVLDDDEDFEDADDVDEDEEVEEE